MKFPVKLLTLFLLLSSCKSDPNAVFEHKPVNSFKYAQLMGMIYDDRNRPCQNAKITITEFTPQKKPVFKKRESNYIDSFVWSDVNGRFSFPLMTKGKYTLLVEKEGFESSEMSLDFSNRTQVAYFKMASYQGLLLKAEEALAKGQNDASMKYWRRASVLNPEDNGWLFFGLILYYKTNSPSSAQQLLKELESRNYDSDILEKYKRNLNQ